MRGPAECTALAGARWPALRRADERDDGMATKIGSPRATLPKPTGSGMRDEQRCNPVASVPKYRPGTRDMALRAARERWRDPGRCSTRSTSSRRGYISRSGGG